MLKFEITCFEGLFLEIKGFIFISGFNSQAELYFNKKYNNFWQFL